MEYRQTTNLAAAGVHAGLNGNSNAFSHRRTRMAASAPFDLQNKVLNGIPPRILEEVRPYLHRVSVRKEEFLLQQDDRIGAVFFPETAILSEFHLLEDGRMVEVAITGRDSVVGVTSMFQHDSRMVNCVQVTQGGTILKMDRSSLQKLAGMHTAIFPILYSALEKYIRQLSQRAVCNMYHSVAQRFCTWLLMVQDRCGGKILKLTHEQIARTLGVYRPSITCIALEMKRKKLIDYSRGGISIKNRTDLERAACDCYAELSY